MQDIVPLMQGNSVSLTTLMQQSQQTKSKVLGILCFSATPNEIQEFPDNSVIPCIIIPMQRLDAADSICEIWQSHEELKQGRHGDIYYRCNDDVLFGVITLSETTFVANASKTSLQQATESAYRQIFSLINDLNYSNLYRFWNYIADINGLDNPSRLSLEKESLDRYSQFNMGRQDAFLAHGREINGNVPAACALGFPKGPLTIAFLAGRIPATQIENPRQISAYNYPKQYGPRSPTFARANLLHLNQHELLFISGTASIVGHATQHLADVVIQTRETLVNIEAVLAEANRVAHQSKFCLADLRYRVYVRHAEDWTRVQAELVRYIGSVPNAMYIQADICRQDLLLEIEATAECPLVSLPAAKS